MTVAATDVSGNHSEQTYEVAQAGTGATLTYDANGNLAGDGTRSFTWDAENRLLTTAGMTYTYDGDGKRASKTLNGSTKRPLMPS